jgi:hypothetical protein
MSMTLSLSICGMIKAGRKRALHVEEALSRKWPVLELDFAKIPDRIQKMKPNLDAMMFDASKLHGSTLFLKLLDDIAEDGLTLKKAAEKPILKMGSRVLANSLPG